VTLVLAIMLGGCGQARPGAPVCRPVAHDLELVDRPEAEGADEIEDSRACFGSYRRLGPGRQAVWRWPAASQTRWLALYAPEEVRAPGLAVNGKPVAVTRLAEGWNPIAMVGAGDPVSLTLRAGDRGAAADAAALAPMDVCLEELSQAVLGDEVARLRRAARTDWSLELGRTKLYPENPIVGCSKKIPPEDVCPSWRLGDGDVAETFRALAARTYRGRGYVFDAKAWNASTTLCKGRTGLDPVACLSCSARVPDFVAREGVVPVGLYHPLYCSPFPGGQCGACLKIRFPDGDRASPKCTPSTGDLFPHCPSYGELGYLDFARLPGTFPIRIRHDEKGEYVIGYVAEWFDNIAGPLRSLPYSIDFASHTGSIEHVGHFPVEYEMTDCPIGDDGVGYFFSDTHGPPENAPHPWLKFRAVGEKRPIMRVEFRIGETWRRANPTSDGFWEIVEPAVLSQRVGVRTTIFSPVGTPLVRTIDLVPAENLCRFQDPDCQPVAH
jgi:hypothetical protein